MDDPLEVSGQEPQLCELEKPVELRRDRRRRNVSRLDLSQ